MAQSIFFSRACFLLPPSPAGNKSFCSLLLRLFFFFSREAGAVKGSPLRCTLRALTPLVNSAVGRRYSSFYFSTDFSHQHTVLSRCHEKKITADAASVSFSWSKARIFPRAFFLLPSNLGIPLFSLSPLCDGGNFRPRTLISVLRSLLQTSADFPRCSFFFSNLIFQQVFSQGFVHPPLFLMEIPPWRRETKPPFRRSNGGATDRLTFPLPLFFSFH